MHFNKNYYFHIFQLHTLVIHTQTYTGAGIVSKHYESIIARCGSVGIPVATSGISRGKTNCDKLTVAITARGRAIWLKSPCYLHSRWEILMLLITLHGSVFHEVYIGIHIEDDFAHNTPLSGECLLCRYTLCVYTCTIIADIIPI